VPKPDTQTAQANNNGKTDVEMPGFVVLAPDDKSGLTCVTADLFLDFSDSTIAGMVKDNEAFVRNIIYEAISKALVTPDKVKINKINMGLSVRKALATMVPRETIRAVFFNKFEII
jgi:flagellar basal body-associated protein FliL